MTVVSAIILGIIEGLTEFLPVSSTGHLIVGARLLGIESTDAVKSFEIAIQVGAIAAIAILYRRTFMQSRRAVLFIMTAFIPTAVIGFLLHGFVRSYLLDSTTVVSWSLLLGGLFLIVFERFHREHAAPTDLIEAMSVRQAVIIGLFQSIAIIPGVSRAAATIIGGLTLGLSRRTIVEFSFLLAVPTMLAATAFDIFKTHTAISGHDAALIGIGGLTSFLVAIVAVRWFLSFIRSHSFTSFGIYRVIVGIVCLLLLK